MEIFPVAGRRILINSVTKKKQHSLLIYDFIVLLNTHAKGIENNKPFHATKFFSVLYWKKKLLITTIFYVLFSIGVKSITFILTRKIVALESRNVQSKFYFVVQMISMFFFM